MSSATGSGVKLSGATVISEISAHSSVSAVADAVADMMILSSIAIGNIGIPAEVNIGVSAKIRYRIIPTVLAHHIDKSSRNQSTMPLQ